MLNYKAISHVELFLHWCDELLNSLLHLHTELPVIHHNVPKAMASTRGTCNTIMEGENIKNKQQMHPNNKKLPFRLTSAKNAVTMSKRVLNSPRVAVSMNFCRERMKSSEPAVKVPVLVKFPHYLNLSSLVTIDVTLKGQVIYVLHYFHCQTPLNCYWNYHFVYPQVDLCTSHKDETTTCTLH